MQMKRPTGITLIAVVYIALAVLSLVWSGLVFGLGGLGSFFGGLFGADNVAALGTSSAWSGFLGIITALVQIVVAIGLLAMKRWAWFLALVSVALTVVQGIVGIFGGGPFALMCGILGLAIPVGILIYLLRPGIRQAFGMQ
jgi:uncharacterized membrane protein (DUF2068 family)